MFLSFANIFKVFFKLFFIPSNNQTLIKYFKKFFRNICKVETCLLSLSCNQLQTLNDNIMTTQEFNSHLLDVTEYFVAWQCYEWQNEKGNPNHEVELTWFTSTSEKQANAFKPDIKPSGNGQTGYIYRGSISYDRLGGLPDTEELIRTELGKCDKTVVYGESIEGKVIVTLSHRRYVNYAYQFEGIRFGKDDETTSDLTAEQDVLFKPFDVVISDDLEELLTGHLAKWTNWTYMRNEVVKFLLEDADGNFAKNVCDEFKALYLEALEEQEQDDWDELEEIM